MVVQRFELWGRLGPDQYRKLRPIRGKRVYTFARGASMERLGGAGTLAITASLVTG